MSGRGRGTGAKTANAPLQSPGEQAASTNPGSNVTTSSDPSGEGRSESSTQSEVHNCSMCGHRVGDDAIGCDRCSRWVHPTVMCSGLPSDAIKTISDLSGDAVLFVCTDCRVKPPSPKGVTTRQSSSASEAGVSHELIQQLFVSVKGICSAVMELTARMDKAFSGNPSAAPPNAQYQPQSLAEQVPHPANPGKPNTRNTANPESEYRSVIRQEMREIQERSKRRQSVIIKGMHATSARDLISQFADLSHSFAGTRVELSDVAPIANHSDLFRAKILDDDHRKLVLDRAKTLRDSEHAHVFIRRDLTFAQRKELRERRAQRNSGDVANAERPENRPNPLNQ